MTAIHPEKQAEIDQGRFDDFTIGEVTEHDDGYTISTTGSTGFGLSKEYGVVPQVGQSGRLYCHQMSIIHGVDLDGRQVFYKDKAEQDAERKKQADELRAKNLATAEESAEEWAAAWEALPQEYQDRKARLNGRNPDWYFEFQPYELFCCTEAHKMANAFRKHMEETGEDIETTITWWRALEVSEQMELGALVDDHTGNTFGFATKLAYWEIVKPENIVQEHGALAMLLGCDGYGCHGPDDFAEKKEDDSASV